MLLSHALRRHLFTNVFLALWLICDLCSAVRAGHEAAAAVAVQVDGRTLSADSLKPVSISPTAQRLLFTVGLPLDAPNASRVRYRLEGIDETWREGPGEMFLAVRFLDAAGDQVGQVTFKATGESAGWKPPVELAGRDGSPGLHCQAALTHRREIVPVPAQAAAFWITISSAGPPATLGCFAVEGITVSRFVAQGSEPELLIRPVFPRDDAPSDAPPAGWVRDGLHRAMAKRVHFGANPTSEGLAIIDDDPTAHAEWHTARDVSPKVRPGDRLLLEWNEAFSVGLADRIEVPYAVPAPGAYRFVATRLDPQGVPTGLETALPIVVLAPAWQRPWFWIGLAAIGGVGIVMRNRSVDRRKIRAHALQLQQERALQSERLRISRDLHDDLGARATHISLLSAIAEEHAALPESDRERFAQISSLSRELAFALYQTVWAVNPENDHLEALVNHLCQLGTKQCSAARLRCRFQVMDLPPDCHVPSEFRHHVCMAFSEAVHNAVKHSQASELIAAITVEEGRLLISVRDNGRGFDPLHPTDGNGLGNLRGRIEAVRGTVTIDSAANRGTDVRFSIPLDSGK
jgi:signal transduction histidine kinase